ncbi:phosphorylase [Antarcticibacterium flavum]|uniref:Uridine phosphorylase n=1 Tax=Antarcticibacterium flavum TaxID=2058175 RepID=A0A5B7X0B2_9FLAO|nr:MULTISPECIES: nucleoside phosphorylase [Antarcticibacterium]MCM4158863.1 phosphorylase [Antarcticibacterium sp. W02-3]QCY68122.1 phosphorylase [Antarcticibacterium flavum]
MTLKASEFIQNADGSVYHLRLLPHQIANTIITVGDPDRVAAVSKYFDIIEHVVQKREFNTHTGTYKGKRITVISSGIGTDNIDIVFNELDALVNIDFNSRRIKEESSSLDIIRIGTSGAIQPDIPIDSFLVSETGIGMDAMLHFYDSEHIQDKALNKALKEQLDFPFNHVVPYAVDCDMELASRFDKGFYRGMTVSNCGFYGPQGRVLRLPVQDPELNSKMERFNYKNRKITNMEMETSGMYGLSKLLGHHTVSLNAIVANRATGEFSKDPAATVDKLIRTALDLIVA